MSSRGGDQRPRLPRELVDMSKTFKEKEVVWAKMRGHPHWPAKVSCVDTKGGGGTFIGAVGAH